MVPRDIQFICADGPRVRIESVTTALEATWFRPTRTAWLHFDTDRDAREACKILNGKVCCGVALLATVQPSKPGPKCCVQLSSLIEEVDESQLRRLLPPHLKRVPSCFYGKLSYHVLLSGREIMEAKVKDLTKLKIRAVEDRSPQNKLKQRVTFRFEGSPNLDALTKRLNEEHISPLGKSKVFAVERMILTVSVAYKDYVHSSREIVRRAAELWPFHHVQINVDDVRSPTGHGLPVTPPRMKITLSGTGRKNLQAAYAWIERILIARESSRMALRTKAVPTQSHRIRLTKAKDFERIVAGTLVDAQRLLPGGVVRLDKDSNPPAVVVLGDTATLRKVQRLLFPDSPKYQTKVTCEICFDEHVEVVRLPGCNHACCQDCFENYCMVERDSKFPLQCFHSGCKLLLEVEHLREHIRSHARLLAGQRHFPDLLQEAVDDHLTRNPETYAKCPSPGCKNFHPLVDGQEQRICTRCLTSICIECKIEQHFGETCEEYEERTSENAALLEKWIRENKAKRCPRCNIPVEKTEGCNNMDCLECKAHFCWVCLEIGKDHREVYNHLMEKHGTYGDDEALQLQAAIDRLNDVDLVDRARLQDEIDVDVGFAQEQAIIQLDAMLRANPGLAQRPVLRLNARWGIPQIPLDALNAAPMNLPRRPDREALAEALDRIRNIRLD